MKIYALILLVLLCAGCKLTGHTTKNSDPVINIKDYDTGREIPIHGEIPTATIPEPNTLLMLATGIAMMYGLGKSVK